MTEKRVEKFSEGDWVEVRPEHDIPPMFRNEQPTKGRVDRIVESGLVVIHVPIGGADVDEHSQSVPYPPEALVPASGEPQ